MIGLQGQEGFVPAAFAILSARGLEWPPLSVVFATLHEKLL